jgi:hypothetical protein
LRSIDDPAAHVDLDEGSYATVEDVAHYRKYGLLVDPTAPVKVPDIELDPDDRVTAATLQDENRPRGHAGGRSKRKRTEARPLTPEERMDRRCRILRDTGADAFLPETDMECEARLIREALRKESRKGGRPRKGAEVREVYGVRLEPELVERIKNTTALDLAAFIEQQAATLYGEQAA